MVGGGGDEGEVGAWLQGAGIGVVVGGVVVGGVGRVVASCGDAEAGVGGEGFEEGGPFLGVSLRRGGEVEVDWFWVEGLGGHGLGLGGGHLDRGGVNVWKAGTGKLFSLTTTFLTRVFGFSR